jgi:hypothetical protein
MTGIGARDVAPDPTGNLHDALFIYNGEDLERWPVDGRRITALWDLQDLSR